MPQLNDVIRETKQHWSKYAKSKKSHTEAIAFMARAQRFTPIEGEVDIMFFWRPKNMRTDPDNSVHAQKYILDGLVTAGVIEGDGYKIIRVLQHEFLPPDKEDPRVEVVIVPRQKK